MSASGSPVRRTVEGRQGGGPGRLQTMRFMIIRKGDAETEAGTMPSRELAQAMMDYHEEMGRHLKILGIFARLNYRDGKPGWGPPIGIVHAMFPARRALVPAVRRLIDFLAENLSVEEPHVLSE